MHLSGPASKLETAQYAMSNVDCSGNVANIQDCSYKFKNGESKCDTLAKAECSGKFLQSFTHNIFFLHTALVLC